MTLPDYYELEEILRRAESRFRVADCHGVLCGLLVVDITAPIAIWLNEILTATAPGSALYEEAERVLEELHDLTRARLRDSNLRFELLLTDSDAMALSERVDNLAHWCHGFVFGLALAGIQDDTAMSGDSAEIVHDITEIARVDNETEFDEEDEGAFLELVEYLRVGVLLIHEEFQALQTSSR